MASDSLTAAKWLRNSRGYEKVAASASRKAVARR